MPGDTPGRGGRHAENHAVWVEPRADPDTVNAAIWTHYGRLGHTDAGAAPDEGAAVPTRLDSEGALRRVSGADTFRLVYALVSNYSGWEPDVMMRIGACESGLRNDALGGPNYDGLYDHGIWQLHGDPRGHDPVIGTAIAHEKYSAAKAAGGTGYEPWSSSIRCWGQG